MVIKCPIDGRSFPSNAALAQHKRASHPAKVAAPRRTQTRNRVRGNGSNAIPRLVSTGVDLVASMPLKAGVGTGTVLLNLPLGPSHLNPSRWRNESALWSRWRPRALRLSIVGSGASTTFGSICAAWCPDDNWVPTGNSHDYMRVAALRPSVTMRLHESRVLTIPAETVTKWLLCDGAPELTNHGSIVVVVATPPGGYTGTCGCTVTLEWAVEFEGIEMPGESTAIGDTITPDSGWSNLFTTSDGSFDGTRLTLKMHSGGDMCPFSAARADHVYEPAGSTKIQYYDSSKNLHECKFFARVYGYSVPGLVLFATRADAVAYITSGDSSKILPYAAAGPVATPARPMFTGTPAHAVSAVRAAPSRATLNAFFAADVARGADLVTAKWSPDQYDLIWAYFNGFRDVPLPPPLVPVHPRSLAEEGGWETPTVDS